MKPPPKLNRCSNRMRPMTIKFVKSDESAYCDLCGELKPLIKYSGLEYWYGTALCNECENQLVAAISRRRESEVRL